MASQEELSDTIEAALAGVGLDAATIERSPHSTIIPPSARVDTAGERAIGLLGELGAATLDRKLELHSTIGEGGMGIVRLGTQRSLGREVAVKSLKADHRGPHSVLKLLREAWVTGGLEHPNVVPVYDIALEADGTPLIVLKKIEGVDWATLMHDARTVRERFGAEDLLEWNLGILMQVANAVRYAHSRNVLHRDLKPENVMIGRFGEVYVVDWGIAVALEDDGSGRLPLASEAREMAGTPLYMAPEMLGGAVSRLSLRTDIYLLGAILYEIVAGEPPHRGAHLMELVSSIVASDPPLPEHVPGELERIVRHAMDPDPDARFENAEQLRLAIQAFLRHRDAARLADRAQERLDELLGVLDRRASQLDGEDREPIYHLFGECRFGFRHALEVWPDNESARDALDRAIQAMVEYELGQGEPEAARALLSEMERVPEELGKRVDAARRAKEEDEAKMRRLRDDYDPSLGRRTRSFLATVTGGLWTIVPLTVGLWIDFHHVQPTAGDEIIVGGLFLAVFAGLGIWARESMTRTAINRRVAFAALLAIVLMIASGLVAVATHTSPFETMHDRFLLWAGVVAVLCPTIDWRLGFAAVGYLVAYVITPFIGIDRAFYVMSAANFVLTANMWFLWAKPKEDAEAAREGMLKRREERRRRLAERFGRRKTTES